jgi:hypothetical protein
MHDLNPSQFRLSQNNPNPFNEHTTIKFCVPYRTEITLEVFDPEGKIVRTLIDEEKDAGTYEIEFSARDATGGAEQEALIGVTLPEGIYGYRLRAGDFSATMKMSLSREHPSPC